MSGENRSSTTPPPPLVVYTVYPDFQRSEKFGSQHDYSETPPPKYEDVISGEYLKSNYSSYNYPSTLTVTPDHPASSPHSNCTCPRTNTLLSDDYSDQDDKYPKCNVGCCALIIFVLITFLVFRMTFLFK